MSNGTAPDSKGSSTAPSSDSDVSTSDDTQAQSNAKRPHWFRITVLVIFGFVYVWDLFVALSNLFAKTDEITRLNEYRVLNGLTTTAVPWTFLITNLLLPLIVFGFALLVARKRGVGILAVALMTGLGVVAAVSLTLTALVRSLS